MLDVCLLHLSDSNFSFFYWVCFSLSLCLYLGISNQRLQEQITRCTLSLGDIYTQHCILTFCGCVMCPVCHELFGEVY